MEFNMYAKGDAVQAVDELGRWEECRVIETVPTGVTVSFVGWSAEFNRTVENISEIRKTIDPFKEDFRVQCRKRSLSGACRQKSNRLKTLCRGDEVSVSDGTVGTVKLVDRFSRMLTIDIDGNIKEVHVTALANIEGFPAWYNKIYEDDEAVYSYKLLEDYRKGDLKIMPEQLH